MKSRRRSVTSAAALVVAMGVLAGCGASAPGANELAHELIDTLDPLTVSEQAKACMHEKVDEYEDDTLDELARRADGGDADAEQAMAEFEAALASCR